MSTSYRHIYEKGKFKDLIFKASNDPSDKGRFWEMVAYFSLGKPSLAEKIVNKYDDTFSSVEDPDLRQNFISYATQLMSLEHAPAEKIQRRQPVFPDNLDYRLRQLFADLFVTADLADTRHGQMTAKHVQYGDYMCKYGQGEEAITKLRRQYDLLMSLQDKLSVAVPNPISFEIEESGELAAFIYRKIPGTRMGYKDKLYQQLLDLILELRQLGQNASVKRHLKPFEPDFDHIAETITVEAVLDAYGKNLTGQDAITIRNFISLCQDHLPQDPMRTFVHGDLYFGNIITNQSGTSISGIIDFERGWYADPWIDFSKLAYNDEYLLQLLSLYDQQVRSIDIDYTIAKILLYRGMFILRRMPTDPLYEVGSKMIVWITKPYPKIKSLLQ